MIQSVKTEKSTAMAMMAVFLLNIFLFSPFLLYTTNIEQFTTPLTDVLKLCLIPSLGLLLLFILVIKFLPDSKMHRVAASLAMFSVLIWFQGNVLLWDYGILDGRSINWSNFLWQGWFDGIVWVVSIVLVNCFYKKIGWAVVKSAIFIFIVQLVTSAYTSYDKWELIHKENFKYSVESSNEIFKFSNNKNILHIVTDGFQSDVFNELLHHDNLKDRYQESFQGFVYYQETLGNFPYTRFAIPAFLAGEIYSNELPKDTYIDKVLKGVTILSVANKEGYEIDKASGAGWLLNRYSNLPFGNMYNIENFGNTNSGLKDTALAIDLALFRVLPHFLKKYVYNNQKWLISQLVVSEQLFQFLYFSHTRFLYMFSQAMSIERERPVYKYIHIMNTHNPMVVDAQCKYSGEAVAMNRVTLTIQSKCTLDTLSMLFDKMKELGVYDNTLIIIHGDHGGWAPNYRQGPPVILSEGIIAPKALTSLASPLLAIKKPNDKANFRVSDVQASLSDIPDTISDIMNWDANFNSQSLEKISIDEPRKRFFRFYFWQRDAWETDYTGPIQEFSIEGSHYEVEWKPEKIYFPPKLKRE
ncbi:MAG: hypothetical protein ACI9XC_000458 [Gammaproteobacteria bacterium]|jgi:hypothetical protein